nr:hypothetical protein [Tanacetum cinerariifolium]
GGDDEEVTESEGESDEEETRQEEEESFDQIPRTPEGSEDEGNDEEDQDLRLRVEFIFTTASSPIVSLQTPTPIMTPSTIATITTSSDAPIPPTTIPSTILENLPTFNSVFRFDQRLSDAPIPPTTIQSIILENLPTFDSVFRFDERLKSLESTFSEYR